MFDDYLYYSFGSAIVTISEARENLGNVSVIGISVVNVYKVVLNFVLGRAEPRFTTLIAVVANFLVLNLTTKGISCLFRAVGELERDFPVSDDCLAILIGVVKVACVKRFSSTVYGSTKCRVVKARVSLFYGLSIVILDVPMLLTVLSAVSRFVV